MKLRDAGIVVGVALIVILLSIINSATGGDKKGEADRITVRPAEEKCRIQTGKKWLGFCGICWTISTRQMT